MRTSGGAAWTEVDYGAVTVLRAANGGAYPSCNSLLVRGSGGTLLVDPSLSLLGGSPAADVVFISHAHEDHLAGAGRLGLPVLVHEGDVAAVRSVEAMLDGLGYPGAARQAFQRSLAEEFRFGGVPDAAAVPDGHVVDLGDRTVTVVHLPGHTPGHSGLLVEPDGFFYVGDIDLSSFGPFYGDLGSDLTAFERSLHLCSSVPATWYGTAHHKGVVTGQPEFRARVRAYGEVVARRDDALRDFFAEPRTIADAVAHRFVYRPHVEAVHVDPVEARTVEQHVDRLLRRGFLEAHGDGRFRAVR